MKKSLQRIIAVIVITSLGAGLFLFFAYIGENTKGPLETLFDEVGINVVNMEKKWIGTVQESRSEKLVWFSTIRADTQQLKHPEYILFGAYDDKTTETYEPILALEDSLRTRLPIIHFYSAWGSKNAQVFPFLRAQAIYDLGSIPMITWEPWLNDFTPEEFPFVSKKEDPNKKGMAAVAKGEFDAYIDQWADAAKKFGHNFFLRFGHEMNDPYRYPWGPQNNEPADYIAAWQHVVKRFRKAGAYNVIWVWSPHPAYMDYDKFYPGHAYVDWLGVTAINYGSVATWSRWWSFHDIFDNCYNWLSKYGKPMMLTEFSSLSVGGDRAGWFEEALDSIPKRYPVVKSIVYFHVSKDVTTTYKALDWSFRTDSNVTAGIRNSMRNWRPKNIYINTHTSP